MLNPVEVAAQVRFALSHLPARNAHHEFEQMCRHLTRQFICSNVLPATGPVSAGGDQGRDFETFRTYLRDELGPHGAFLGLVREGPVAFTCTLQADNVTTKISSDVATVCASGQPVHEIHAFTLASVPVGARHRLQNEVHEEHNVRLEFHDLESITELIATPDGFWIAEHFLSLPAEVRPAAPPDDGNLPEDYVQLRIKWRDDPELCTTLGTFLDLKAGLRESLYREAAHRDLPFWLGHIRELLANSELPADIQQRARYELVVATLRGTGDMLPVDQVARAYLDESLQESEPARLEDAGALLMYVHSAAQIAVTTIRPAELDHWDAELTSRIEELIPDATPHRRASLLSTLGLLGLHPVLSDDQFTNGPSFGDIDPIPPPWATQDTTLSFPPDCEYRDASRALSAWTELVERLEETPLFPLQRLADVLQMLLPLWSTQAEWRRLLDLVDDEMGAREGKNTVAERARDRAMALMNVGRLLEALEEMHRARVDWWSGETVRGSVLASLVIAELFGELRLFAAAKAYALGAATVAVTSGDEELADLAPRGLLLAASLEFLSGAWYSAAELYELGFSAQHQMGGGINFDEDEMIQNAVLQLSYTAACAREVDPSLESTMQAIVDRGGFQEVVDEVIAHGPESGQSWGSFGEGELSSPPFSDLGPIRCIRFMALGMNWTLLTGNDNDSVRLAERFAAGVQAMLAALAREDLCLIPTDITVRIEQRQQAAAASSKSVEALPSNDGREWIVRLTPTRASNDARLEDINLELLKVLGTILLEVSLLPSNDLLAIIERAFQHGLGHKLSPAVQLQRFAETFANNEDEAFDRRSIEVPWECPSRTFTSHDELRWQDGPGPTVTSTGGCDRSAMMAGCSSQHPIRWRFTVWHSASAQRNACVSMRWRGRASTSMRWPGAWAGTARRSIASSSAAAGAAAMTPRPRRRLRICGLAGPRRPSWRAIPCWPRLSAGCSPTGCRRTRSRRSCAQRATASARRRSTPPAMTTAAPGACPRAPGSCCRGAAGSAGPGAATRESPARWAISRRSRSARPASRTAASPATGRAI